jgi:alkylation response protein AidB-like acyl-CoA dehydrogenase
MLDFHPSSDQEQIIAALAKVLEGETQSRMHADGTSCSVAQLAELGWIGIAVPESCGGSGGSLVDEALVARELGRALVVPDVLATQLGAHISLASGDTAGAQALVVGESTAAFAVAPDLTASGAGEQDWSLLSASVFERVVSLADDDATMHECRTGEIRLIEGVDPDLRLARASLQHLPARARQPGGAIRGRVLLAAMLVGNAEGSCRLAVDYAKSRVQFGRPIGSFQAVKHRCADMHVRARLACAQALRAAMLTDAAAEEAPQHVEAAFIVAAEAALRNGESCIQVHGGMGFSAECLAHRYLKRALVLATVGGGLQGRYNRLHELVFRVP